MEPNDLIVQRFERERPRLRAVASRMLGSVVEAEDAVQEAWLRLHRTRGVENVEGWLTTAVSRVCLDLLRARKARREIPLEADRLPSPSDPAHEALLADAVEQALLVVLDAMTPAERVAFVLHDTFDLSFEEVAAVLGRSPAAARQLASRARRRVRGAETPDRDDGRRRALIEAFRTAAREGDLAGLLAVLAPDVVLRADPVAVAMGAPAEAHGPKAIVDRFLGRAQAARPARVGGEPSLAWVVDGAVRVAFRFTILNGRITVLELLGDPRTHARLRVAIEG